MRRFTYYILNQNMAIQKYKCVDCWCPVWHNGARCKPCAWRFRYKDVKNNYVCPDCWGPMFRTSTRCMSCEYKQRIKSYHCEICWCKVRRWNKYCRKCSAYTDKVCIHCWWTYIWWYMSKRCDKCRLDHDITGRTRSTHDHRHWYLRIDCF